MALGSITEGPPKVQFSEVIVATLSMLMDMFKDPSSKVRQANSWVIARICDHHADVLLEPNTLKNLMFHLITALTDQPKISAQCCQAIEKLAIACETQEGSCGKNPLAAYYKEILQHLEHNGNRQDF